MVNLERSSTPFQRYHLQVVEDWRGNESPKRTTDLAQCHDRWVPLLLNGSCLLRLKRSRERDLSSDLTVCALIWRANSAG